MENLIDKRYFWGELAITGLFKEESESELTMFITKYQKKYLKEMFYTAFDGETGIPADILEMLYDEATLTSPIANYVYYFWQRKNATIQTNAGVKGTATQNTVAVSPADKICAAWNEMVDTNIEIQQHMYDEASTEYDYLNGIYLYLNQNIFTKINSFGI